MKTLLKRNMFNRLLCIALTAMIVAGFLPMRAEAYDFKIAYKIIALNQNKYVTSKDYSYSYNEKTDTETETYYMYKINVPANGYIRIETKSVKNVSIYKSFNRKKELYESDSIAYLEGKRVYREVLPKGTYYIHADKWVKFKWSFVKVKNGSNYCMSRAEKLASGKKKIVLFNYRQEFDKWYKVTLSQKKTITFAYNLKEYEPEFYIYNSRGYRVNCPELTERSWRTAILPRGTYYIRVCRDRDDDDYSYYRNRLVQIWWR